MKILVNCEASQTICNEFRKRGFEAYSCDLEDCYGGNPQWHIKGDAIKEAYSGKYGFMIGHPPCTFLTVSANKWLKDQPARKSGALVGAARRQAQQEAKDFFMALYNAPIKHIAIENPIGVMSTAFRKPDQIIEPYQFGENAKKPTCLWLKNLPLLIPTEIVEPELVIYNGKKYSKWGYKDCDGLSIAERQKIRNKTFPGIAKAIVDQWGSIITAA